MTKRLPRRRFWYDCEFVEDGVTIRLLSIGVVCEDGREFYAVNSGQSAMGLAVQREWLRDNVLPYLPVILTSPETAQGLISPPSWRWEWDKTHPDYGRVRAHAEIAHELLAFLNPEECEPELWAYYGSYDHVAYAQLFGAMVDLPAGLPQVTHELVQRWEDVGRPPKPEQLAGQHNAIADARWNAALWQVCEEARSR
jgi:hypothetical protein